MRGLLLYLSSYFLMATREVRSLNIRILCHSVLGRSKISRDRGACQSRRLQWQRLPHSSSLPLPVALLRALYPFSGTNSTHETFICEENRRKCAGLSASVGLSAYSLPCTPNLEHLDELFRASTVSAASATASPTASPTSTTTSAVMEAASAASSTCTTAAYPASA